MNRRIIEARLALIVLIMGLLLPIFIGPTVVTAQSSAKKIAFDYSHGQYKTSIETLDLQLAANLTQMGYEVSWAWGGINATFLADKDALILGSIAGTGAKFLQSEIDAIAEWFAKGGKFLWVAYDSDYTSSSSGQWILDNMTAVLKAVNSHVYGEPTAVQDPVSNCGSAYRVVANKTSSDPFVANLVENVTHVLMHGPTLLYGSTSGQPGNPSAVALETHTIPNVYPLLYYGGNTTIVDSDATYPYVHEDGDKGEFVAMTLELMGSNVLVVSGASPYGDYQPMYTESYYNVTLDGYNLVKQTIDFGLKYTPPFDYTMLLIVGGVAVVVIIVVVFALMRKK